MAVRIVVSWVRFVRPTELMPSLNRKTLLTLLCASARNTQQSGRARLIQVEGRRGADPAEVAYLMCYVEPKAVADDDQLPETGQQTSLCLRQLESYRCKL